MLSVRKTNPAMLDGGYSNPASPDETIMK